MARNEKAKAKLEQARGKTKETSARAVGNESKTGEGRMEKAKGDLRQAKEKAKDAFRD
ncbi:CsbD family protein [Streptomyces glaucescens]|uniref:CsbD family protein n=1 Tax=Streptomyces glaucescens TaxID=1907 RepID=UPI00344D79A4